MTPAGEVATLYHYTGLEAFQSIVSSGILYATDRRYLNDASEFVHAFTLLGHAIDERRRAQPDYSDFCDRLDDDRKRIEDIPKFITSFSETGDSLSQWQRYCPSGGFAIGFSFQRVRERAEALRGPPLCLELAKCEYTDAHKKKLVEGFVGNAFSQAHPDKQFKEYYSSQERWKIETVTDARSTGARSMLWHTAAVAATWKDSAFEDEHEWRLIISPSQGSTAEESRVHYRQKNSSKIPYIKIDLRSAQALPIVEVIVGPMRSDGLASAAEDALGALGLRRDMVRHSTIPYREL